MVAPLILQHHLFKLGIRVYFHTHRHADLKGRTPIEDALLVALVKLLADPVVNTLSVHKHGLNRDLEPCAVFIGDLHTQFRMGHIKRVDRDMVLTRHRAGLEDVQPGRAERSRQFVEQTRPVPGDNRDHIGFIGRIPSPIDHRLEAPKRIRLVNTVQQPVHQQNMQVHFVHLTGRKVTFGKQMEMSFDLLFGDFGNHTGYHSLFHGVNPLGDIICPTISRSLPEPLRNPIKESVQPRKGMDVPILRIPAPCIAVEEHERVIQRIEVMDGLSKDGYDT
ncbi:MAG: hypothetical protein BWY82_02259 [Verrucomicrobia bacterium ADurb.Bin474]|nr:MAG: hypothetical protein BWY82_02259 [Verrucomicrobia bacterium ADurb.Bin474]